MPLQLTYLFHCHPGIAETMKTMPECQESQNEFNPETLPKLVKNAEQWCCTIGLTSQDLGKGVKN